MVFAGSVPQDFGGADTPDGYGIYNLTDGVLALSGWYPILSVYDEDGWNLDPVSAIGDSVYSDTALYSVRICAPADLTLAATGVATGEQAQETDTCTRFESGPVRDFFIAASRDFDVVTETVDGVAVNSYYLPGHESPGRQALEISVDSLRTYNEKFGLYPFVELDVIDAPMRNALGVEYPGIILVAQSLYDTPDRPDFAVATSHEVAHQWWYSVIGNDVFEEPWLDEALTSFSSTLYFEFTQSTQYAQGLWQFWQERYDRLKAENRDDPVAESLEYFETGENRSYATVVYTKGALFFDALRDEIGDDAFFTALQQYYADHKYGIARGEDLLAAFEAAAGRELDDFYQAWLYSPQ
jgi:aminopeptidase N